MEVNSEENINRTKLLHLTSQAHRLHVLFCHYSFCSTGAHNQGECVFCCVLRTFSSGLALCMGMYRGVSISVKIATSFLLWNRWHSADLLLDAFHHAALKTWKRVVLRGTHTLPYQSAVNEAGHFVSPQFTSNSLMVPSTVHESSPFPLKSLSMGINCQFCLKLWE